MPSWYYQENVSKSRSQYYFSMAIQVSSQWILNLKWIAQNPRKPIKLKLRLWKIFWWRHSVYKMCHICRKLFFGGQSNTLFIIESTQLEVCPSTLVHSLHRRRFTFVTSKLTPWQIRKNRSYLVLKPKKWLKENFRIRFWLLSSSGQTYKTNYIN